MIGVGSEVESGAGAPTQRRREPAEELLRLEDADLLTAFREREPGGEATDAAADDYGVTQRGTSDRVAWGFEA